jgi:hypothetical protein
MQGNMDWTTINDTISLEKDQQWLRRYVVSAGKEYNWRRENSCPSESSYLPFDHLADQARSLGFSSFSSRVAD